MLKFFRRSKNKKKSTNNDVTRTPQNLHSGQLNSNISETTNYLPACARTNSNVINKTQENPKSVDYIDHFDNVLVQINRNVNDQQEQARHSENEFKKEISSRNEIVDQKQCQFENVSNRSISIGFDTIQHSQLERDRTSRNFLLKPINKGREFFNGIMAKGRNRNRNRNKNKDGKNQNKDYYQSTTTDIDRETKVLKGGDRTSVYNKINSPAEKNISGEENIQFGYQITKSKNSLNLVMRCDEENDHDENDDGLDESSSNKTDSSETEGGNTTSTQEDECAGAIDENSCENRNRIDQFDVNCENHHNELNGNIVHRRRIEHNENENSDYDYTEYWPKSTLHTPQHFEGPRRQHPPDFVDVQLNDEVEPITDRTECDLDNYLNIEMGQQSTKPSSTSNYCQDQQNKNQSSRNHVIIPTITIADYSDHDNGISNESEIFYDSEQSFDPQIEQSKRPFNIKKFDNESNTNTINNENSEWYFVANESDRVTIDDDPDPNNHDLSFINGVNSHSENFSTTSFSVLEKDISTPDSGLGSSGNILLIDSRTIVNESDTHLNCDSGDSFLRGSSTDCDDNILQSDYEIISDTDDPDNPKCVQPILIDSISLPDVVVESTGMGSANSIPIKVEPIDISVSINNFPKPSSMSIDHKKDKDKRDLINQEARYSAQFEEAQRTVYNSQLKIGELQKKIDELENDLSVKSWNVDRLQAELDSARKEDDCLRRRLKILEEEKGYAKQQLADLEAEQTTKYEDLETQLKELQDKYNELQILSRSLQTQLAFAQSDMEQCRLEKDRLQEEKDEEIKSLRDDLQKSHADKKECEMKWQKEFETLRTQIADKEEQLYKDCEWQMRSMQKTCKDKITTAEKDKIEALEKAAEVQEKLNEQEETFRHLKCCEAELRQLRGLSSDQKQSIVSLMNQMEDLRSELYTANQDLEDQIAEVRRIKKQCEITISIKDREMIQKIEEARGEVAMLWESKLLTEMTRLTTELETVNVEDRQEALRQLQEEHVEELRALTTRYTANEEELNGEIKSLQAQLEQKNIDYRELKEKTDAALLETRLHLERADHDFQRAMNREEDKREILIEQMKKEFEKEKLEMEDKFRERLNQVKEEFAKELANTSDQLTVAHRKQLEKQWEQLVAEKEEALQTMETRYRIKIEEAENRIKDLEIEHQRDMKEMKNNFDVERVTLESRDLHNSQEIEQLHRKCRCLTNLFEEMRMRYERRDPRPEDLHEIAELRSRCEAQERDLQLLTERMRDMQMNFQEQQAEQLQTNSNKRKHVRKPPPKTIPTSCDVIYEENEERESPDRENGLKGKTTTTNEIIEDLTVES